MCLLVLGGYVVVLSWKYSQTQIRSKKLLVPLKKLMQFVCLCMPKHYT